MTRGKNIAKRVQEVLLDGKWIANTNFKEQIESVTYLQANQKIGDLNTIGLLTFHINYYLGGVLQVFQGGPLTIRDKYSFDMPPITSEDDWQNLKESFYTNAKTFIELTSKMSDNQLAAVFVKEEYGNYERSIEGIIEHSYYHLGQVVLINKLIKAKAE